MITAITTVMAHKQYLSKETIEIIKKTTTKFQYLLVVKRNFKINCRRVN